MICQQTNEPLVQAYIDGELDLVDALKIEAHFEECEVCAANYLNHRALRSALNTADLYFRTPARLGQRVQAALDAARGSATGGRPLAPKERWTARWYVFAAGLAACAAIFLLAGLRYLRETSVSSRNGVLAQEVLDSHVRSLMENQLTEVTSSNQHTVKPWFDGKIDFSPPVQDFSQEGFPLLGGRRDYLDGREVAALVYGHGKHLIDLFVWPAGGQTGVATTGRLGYTILQWSQNGMAYWAVSDVDPAALRQFVKLLRANERAVR